MTRSGCTVVAAFVVSAGVLAGSVIAGRERRQAPPLGLDAYLPTPEENAITAEKTRLGERLFFDTKLSADTSISCATCHQPSRAFTDGRPRSRGVFGRVTVRNTPSVLNAGYGAAFFWDGRIATLEEQVLQPIIATEEMGATLDDVVRRLRSDTGYRAAFRDALGEPPSAETIGKALATFVRTRRSAASPMDRYLDGDQSAADAQAIAGLRIFQGRARCVECHHGPLLTDGGFHNTGVGWGGADPGRARVTGEEADRGRFKTPSLRNVALTAPYMHDGSLATLEDVVEFYARGGNANPLLDTRIRPLDLSSADKRALIAYLRALTSIEYARPPSFF